MNNEPKLDLKHFLSHTHMYVYPLNFDNVANYLNGYEHGINNKDITSNLKQFVIKNHSVNSSSDGWIGQMKRLSNRLNQTPLETFKEVVSNLIEKINT